MRATIAVDETEVGAIDIETGVAVEVATDAVQAAAAEGIETADDVAESSQIP